MWTERDKYSYSFCCKQSRERSLSLSANENTKRCCRAFFAAYLSFAVPYSAYTDHSGWVYMRKRWTKTSRITRSISRRTSTTPWRVFKEPFPWQSVRQVPVRGKLVAIDYHTIPKCGWPFTTFLEASPSIGVPSQTNSSSGNNSLLTTPFQKANEIGGHCRTAHARLKLS